MSDAAIFQSAFIIELTKQMRALDTYGVQDKATPQALLEPFVVTREQRRNIPVVGDPSPQVLTRVGAFYNAIAMLIEQECGLMARPIINLSHEGFGAALIVVGRLVVMDKVLRDVHRFGFESLPAMKDESDKLLSVALAMVGNHSDIAGM